MESIGAILKNERTKRGISLAEAHEATKITMQNLVALEEDRFESFPNRVYARAFLRDYANYLGLESSALLERYESEWGTKPPSEAAGGQGGMSVGLVVLAVLVLGIIAAGVFWAVNSREPSAGRPPEQTVERPEREPAQKPEPAPQPAAKPETADTAPVVPETPKPAPAEAEELKLQLTGTGQSWMRVQADGNPPEVFTLQPGEVRGFTAKNKFTIRVGQPGAVRAHLNGQPLPQLGPAGQPVTKELDRSLLKTDSAPAGTGPAAGQVEKPSSEQPSGTETQDP